MLDLRFIRENPEKVRWAIQVKRVDLDLDQLLAVDQAVLKLKRQIQALNEEKNTNSKKMGKATPAERPQIIQRGKEIGEELKSLEPRLRESEETLRQLQLLTPNIPDPDVPVGVDDSENVEVYRWGEQPTFDFTPLDHVQILENHNWADFKRIAEVAGSRSYLLKNEMAILEYALHRFVMDRLMEKGFTFMTVPSLTREFALVGTGHFPTGRDQVYYLPADDLYLSGTAEVPLNSLHAGEILSESDLPMKYAAISPCFRREAGSGGRDVRGLIRVHQFTKIEQFILCKNDPEESRRWHDTILGNAKEILEALEIPYRVVEVCTGDMGAGKTKMHDIESWVPSEKKYRETHSCSSLGDWQARRTNLRYRDAEGKVQFCYTLNNTALATPRFLVPFLENHQQADGSIRIPAALQPYLWGKEKLG